MQVVGRLAFCVGPRQGSAVVRTQTASDLLGAERCWKWFY